jgi:hypothetical protein
MANGERHAALDPSGHRVPEAAPVRRFLAPNAEAVSFYSRAGFGSHGVIPSKELTAGGDSSTQPSGPTTA